jgi:hypothetical protein
MTVNSIDQLFKNIIIRTIDESSERHQIFFKTLVRHANRTSTQKYLCTIQFIFTLFIPFLHDELASFDEIIEKELENTGKPSQYCAMSLLMTSECH